MSEPQSDDPMVAALLREREACQRQDKPDRVALINEQLRMRGWTDPESADDGAEKPPAGDNQEDRTPPKGRRTTAKRTT